MHAPTLPARLPATLLMLLSASIYIRGPKNGRLETVLYSSVEIEAAAMSVIQTMARPSELTQRRNN
jgi:hypothetical protein